MISENLRRVPGRPAMAGRGRTAQMLRAAITLLAVLALAGGLAGCGSGGDGGYNLNPPEAGVWENSGPVHVGQQAGFPVYLPVSKMPVTLVSARLLTIPGFPAPRLTHLGVWRILHGLINIAPGWPPTGCGGSAPCNAPGARFAGFRLTPGDSIELVYFWVAAPPRLGEYYVAGLRVTYRVGSGTYTGNLFSGGGMCVWPDRQFGTGDACTFSNKADAVLTRMAGQST